MSTKMAEQKPDKRAEQMQRWAELSERAQQIFAEYGGKDDLLPPLAASSVARTFHDLFVGYLARPENMINHQVDLWKRYADLWSHAAKRFMGEADEPVKQPGRGDRRFRDDAWNIDPVFDVIKQSYLITSDWLFEALDHAENIDPNTKHRAEFYLRQMVSAASPSNFITTNPEVIKKINQTDGESLINGFENFLDDLEAGKGRLKISMADDEAFEVGKNLATTPGQVIFRNKLFELIQYVPQTETVFDTPLLIVPPWINKFYILDLTQQNSLINWLVGQGHSVFVMSWVNPDEGFVNVTFEDYVTDALIPALEQMADAVGHHRSNIIGYCIGGTLLAMTQAYFAKTDHPFELQSATYLTTLLDFSDPGDLGAFIDEDQVAELEKRMADKGYLEAQDLQLSFNMLRPDDLIWSFFVNNYLMGERPAAFDLLFWNSDSTRLPAAMHSFYLRNMYLENNLITPNAITVDGVGVDLTKIETPNIFISTERDHIAPWKATYQGAKSIGGDQPVSDFILAESGHIAGVINPPAKQKYGHWVGKGGALPDNPDDWKDQARFIKQASWWPSWQDWIADYTGDKVKARNITDGLCDAPGKYVRE